MRWRSWPLIAPATTDPIDLPSGSSKTASRDMIYAQG
jgi:hypothetical protein